MCIRDSSALSQHDAGHYRLLLCDLQLPDGDGASFFPAFRSANPEAAIICVSGNSQTGRDHSQKDIVFLAKPYSFVSLNNAVTRLFGDAA